jgi:hypothetical protein
VDDLAGRHVSFSELKNFLGVAGYIAQAEREDKDSG